MIHIKQNLRKVVAIAICLAGFLSANNVLAEETITYTDPSGVTAIYKTIGTDMSSAVVVDITNVPTSVTKWVIPEYITFSHGTVPVTQFTTFFAEGIPINNTLTEIVFPRQFTYIGGSDVFCSLEGRNSVCKFTNIRKITFGEKFNTLNCYFFAGQPLDTVIFLGSDVINVPYQGSPSLNGGCWTFKGCPSTTKIIVPCGTLDIFVGSFPGGNPHWQGEGAEVTWTTANFEEAECLNTLTVLSNDINLGNAISINGCTTLTTTTPDNTTTTFSGTATLYALAKGGTLFVGWDDGNLENPRIVTVSSDTTFTANFATCNGAGIQDVRAASSLKVYPNPTANTLHVEMEREVNNGTLTLFDLNGKAALSQPINGRSAQMNMSMLNTGNYILRLVENGTASAGVQVIKQ